MSREHNAKSLIKTVKRKTRKLYSTEEKIRVVIEGIRGEYTISELCRKEGITEGSVASNVRKNQIFYINNKKDVQRSLFS